MKRLAVALAALTAACGSPAATNHASGNVVAFKLGQYHVDATLTLPPGVTKPPVIVMMGGSGPTDQDETIGVLKPFRDIAAGLARRGVATLRYTKSVRRALTTARFTPTDEYEFDARDAFAWLQTRPDVDHARIFLLGHSLGGTMAPRVARDEPRYRGVILMAAATETFAELVVRQAHYFVELGRPGAADSLAAVQEFARMIDDPNLKPDTQLNSPLAGGTTGAYFLDLRNYNAVATAKALRRPLLLLQGERDYQVTVRDDLDTWTAGLAGVPDVVVKRYPAASHAFVDGTGTPSPDDYATAGHVDPNVVRDISAWVRAH